MHKQSGMATAHFEQVCIRKIPRLIHRLYHAPLPVSLDAPCLKGAYAHSQPQAKVRGWEGEMRIRLGVLCLLLIASGASAQSLEEQAICTKQAKVVFEEHTAGHTGKDNITNDYQSHYNPKLYRCFITVEMHERKGHEFFVEALLMDAFERHVYAVYVGVSREGKESTTCDLAPPSEEQTHCSSKDEYDAFVAKYMEE